MSTALAEIKPIEFDQYLEKKNDELSLSTDRRTPNDKAVQSGTAMFALSGPGSALCFWTDFGGPMWPCTAGVFFGIMIAALAVTSVVVVVLGLKAGGRLIVPADPQVEASVAAAKAYLKERRQDIRRLRQRVAKFNRALGASQAAHARLCASVDPGLREATAAYWNRESEAIRADIDEFCDGLESAWRGLGECRNREAAQLRFHADVKLLLEMEEKVDDYPDRGAYEGTYDCSPWAAAAQLRRSLEDRRDELGLPYESLPPPPQAMRPKLLLEAAKSLKTG